MGSLSNWRSLRRMSCIIQHYLRLALLLVPLAAPCAPALGFVFGANSASSWSLQSKKDEAAGPKRKRPFLASECNNLGEADKWRYQILKEVAKKVEEIQNPGLGEHK